MKFLVLSILITFGFIRPAFAEDGCPSGQYPQQGNGWRSCVPAGNSTPQGSDSQFVQPYREARWIALTADTTEGVLGHSADSRTEDEAVRSAIADCTAQGGRSCKVVTSAKNGCIAIAVGDTRFEADSGRTADEASTKVIDECTKYPSKNCKILYSGCVKPVLR
ncbi:DUF4189 domain-containing protein [Luteibacter pinisoli]|uniref:DUF4189 domain-containing protein n=1 Tax=Luteibacter pinisoli TaxID=2589080 RepID=A0A4Y5Z139_9GAMM|nr:DUF4189 domain-containing protein [Luteibacter pinisoli]QDE38921.1 DUF4189 domain-containing protein [Luteibacter pinisoli]